MTLSEKIKDLFNEINDNKLLSIADLSEIFEYPYFEDFEIFVLNSKKSEENIIPSLSFRVKKSKNNVSFKTYSELVDIYSDLQLANNSYSNLYDENRNIKNILNKITKERVNFVFRYITEHNLMVITKNKYFLELDIFDKLINLISALKQSSLNMINLSHKKSVEDLRDIRDHFKNSIAQTSQLFSDYFEKKYMINTVIFERKYNDKKWRCQRHISKHVRIDIENNGKLIEYGNAIYKKIDEQYILLLPFQNEEKSVYLKYFFLLTSSVRIPKYIVTNFYKFANYYFNVFLEKSKRQLINDLQSEIIKIQESQQYLKSDFDPKEELNKFSKSAFSEVLNVTNAFSATIRLYNPNTRSLELLVDSESEEITNVCSSSISKSIFLSNMKSVNVQTFQSKSNGSYTYISDMTEQGIKCREDSNSELCIPFYFKKIKIGVANFESPLINGFNRDEIEYLLKVTGLIQQFYVQIMELNDKTWLSRRSQVYQNFHEIDNIINDKDFPERYQKILQDLIKKQQISLDNEYSQLSKLNEFRDDFFESYKLEMIEEVYNNFKNNVIFKINPNILNVEVKKSVVDSLIIIIKNILINHRKHADKARDTINLMANHRMIHIVVDTRIFAYSNFNKFFIAPYETKASETKTHYGLFSIGMLARHLGGTTYIYSLDEVSRTKIFIKIPIQRSWMQ